MFPVEEREAVKRDQERTLSRLRERIAALERENAELKHAGSCGYFAELLVTDCNCPQKNITLAESMIENLRDDLVGYTCIACGRLYEAPHRDDCKLASGKERGDE